MERSQTEATTKQLHAGLEGIVVAHTRISDVRGDAGQLLIAGHPVESFAPSVSLEQTVAILWSAAGMTISAQDVQRDLARSKSNVAPVVMGAGVNAMEVLRAGLAQLSSCGDDISDAYLAIATAPKVIAAWRGVALSEPAAPMAYVDLCMRALGVSSADGNRQALSTYLVSVIDHGMNASTFASRVVASTGSDLISAVVSGIGALKGPLHGGAPGPVLDMLDAIGEPANAKPWLLAELASGRRIMGMGHRIYRVRDPRAAVLEQAIAVLMASGRETPRLALARAVESAATEILRERKPDRPLCANVEFYTAVLLDALGIDRQLFTATFALGRIIGWCAHVMEQRVVGKLIRPDSVYVGPMY
jgi:citrate synthase